LDGLETAIVSITDPLEMVVANGFVTRFPGSCNLHLLVNEVRICDEAVFILPFNLLTLPALKKTV